MLSLSDIVNVKVGIGKGAFWTPGCTVIGGNAPTFDPQIQKLFANGEQGFFYDPNDLSTMFQDAEGTVPVTGVGQPVGLMLDKSNGLVLGPELVSNGDFSQPLTGWLSSTRWESSAIVSDGELVVTAHQEHGRQAYAINCVIGKTYVVTGGCRLVSGSGAALISISANALGSNALPATVNDSINPITTRAQFTATSETHYVVAGSVAGVGVTAFDNISVRELSGNHAYQTQSSMRPLLVAAPQRLDYDAVDDNLITNLPTQLAGCTVIRSVPNVGTQILTNQTIPTPYNDNIDHCGLIAINRALTASETSQITKLFNKAAGV